MEGKSCCKLSEGINKQNSIPKISPPEYRGEAGQSYDPLTHSLPYQKATANIPKKKKLAANCIFDSFLTCFSRFLVV
jgi:hypothetical protein